MSFRAKGLTLLAAVSLMVIAWQGVALSEQIEVITLKWAQQQAYVHSPERMRLDLELENVTAEINELLKDPNLLLPWNSHNLEALKSRNEQRRALERSYLTTESAVKNSVGDAFSALILSHRQLETQNRAIQVLEEKYMVEVERVKLGLSTELSARALEISLKQARLDLSRAQDTLKQMEMQFNVLTGRDIWAEVVLEEPVEETYDFVPQEIDFHKSLAAALVADHGSAKAMRQSYEDARDAYRHLYNPRDDVHGEGAKLEPVRLARLRFEQAEITYNRFVLDFTITHWNAYRNLLAMEEAVLIAVDELELERLKLEIEEEKDKVGLASMEQVVEQLNKTVQKELSYNSRVESYNRALRSFLMTERGE